MKFYIFYNNTWYKAEEELEDGVCKNCDIDASLGSRCTLSNLCCEHKVILKKTNLFEIVQNSKDNSNYEPYTFEDRNCLCNKWVIHKDSEQTYLITAVLKNGVVIYDRVVSFEELLEDYEFIDSSICGIKHD